MAASLIRLIHWNAPEAAEKAILLKKAGYAVEHKPLDASGIHELRQEPPTAVVIDLTRLPGQGRDLALALRKYKSTRHVPLVLVDGEPEKVARIKTLLPDAVFTTWAEINAALKQAIAKPPAKPVVPDSIFAAYAGKPLAEKLGIKAEMTLVCINAPSDFEKTLRPLPPGVKIRNNMRGKSTLTIWFTTSKGDLERRIEKIGAFSGKDGLWIVWPKKTSGIKSDLSQPVVRKIGLASWLVDYKVCAVDATWTGLKFVHRKIKR